MDADTVDLIARLGDEPQFLDLGTERKLAILPGRDGWKVEDVSRFLPPPERIKQSVELLNLPSLVDYANKFKGETTAIFADESRALYDVVLDYHGANGQRGEKDHVARYTCPQSEAWQVWTASNAKQMTQVDFAKFLEANLIDIVRPASADMLQVVLSLQVKKSVKFDSDIVLGNGQTQLSYTEEIRNEHKAGKIAIPDVFSLGLPVFIDGDAYPLDARLRYRLSDEGKLSMWYELVRPNDVYRAAVKAVTEKIRTQLADVPFWIGKRS